MPRPSTDTHSSPRPARATRSRGARVAAAVLAAAATCVTWPAAAVAADGSLTLSPSRATGTAAVGSRVGPFLLHNTSRATFETTIRPVLLGQARDGAFHPVEDAAALERAAAMLDVPAGTQSLPPGGRISVPAVVRALSPDRNLYAGVLLRNAPAERAPGVNQVFQIVGTMLLDPPRSQRRIELGSEPARVETGPKRSLRILTPLIVGGNTHVVARGTVTVTDASGREVVARDIAPQEILPDHTVDIATVVTELLPAGTYRVRADLRARGRRKTVRGSFRLFGPNQLAERRARLRPLVAPKAEIGDPAEMTVRFTSTGNVPVAPMVVAELRRLGPRGFGPVFERRRVRAAMTSPGRDGTVDISLPALDAGSYDVRVTLLDGRVELDAAGVAFTPAPRRTLADRLEQLARTPAALVGMFVLLLLGMAAWFRRREARLVAALRTAAVPASAPVADAPVPAAVAVAAAPVPATAPAPAPAPPAPAAVAAPAPARAVPAPAPAPALAAATAATVLRAAARASVAKPVPVVAATPAPVPARTVPATPPFEAAIRDPRAIDINSASVDELSLLPGVGRGAARRIVAEREAAGPFASAADLRRVEGFDDHRIGRLRARAVV